MAFIFSSYTSAQESDSLSISLLTCGAGDDVYSIFGHSAVRVKNHTKNRDWVYNYGTFDFNEPGFYQIFLRGKLEYRLAVHAYSSFIKAYNYQERSVIEQDVQVSQEVKNKIDLFLTNNSLPENRNYLYDFFYDNCSTRIRDIVDRHMGLTLISPPEDNRNLTFRQGLDIYNNKKPWIDFGMDLILGLPSDKVMNFRQEMYLPDFLSDNLSRYYLVSGDQSAPILTTPKKILTFDRSDTKTVPWPLIVFTLLFILMLLYQVFFRSNKMDNFIDIGLFTILGLLGIIITFMWFGTDHMATRDNLNIIWLHPLYLGFVYLIIKKIRSTIPYIIMLSLIVLLMVSWRWLPQDIHIAIFPIIGLIGLRCINRIKLASASEIPIAGFDNT